MIRRSRWVALFVAFVLVSPGPAPLRAEVSSELVDGLVRDTYRAIRDDAFSPPDLLTLLHHTVLTAQQALVSSGVAEPPPLPVFSGQEAQDLTTAGAYVQAAVGAVPSDAERVLAAVLRAMVRTLGDSQGAVYGPVELTRYLRELYGEHSGIGAQVDAVLGQMVITDVSPSGPAGRAGLQAGVALLEVGGRSTAGSTPDQVMDRLRGTPGTSVTLLVRRADGGVSRLALSRDAARENPTRWKMLGPRVGYLRLLEFPKGTSTDVYRALAGLMDAGAAALLLDLRRNGGGLLDEGVAVASAFLADGIVAMEERRGTLTPLEVLPRVRRFPGPVVVLVSHFTASASEVVAGALQDTGVTLVGEKTFGKGTVQTIYTLRGGWGLRLTTSRYYTRRGRSIDGRGLQPEIRVPMQEELIQSPRDVQLQAAAVVLDARLASGPGERR